MAPLGAPTFDEEPFCHPMRGKLLNRSVMRVFRIIGVNGDELIVRLPLILHAHDANDSGSHNGERSHGLLP